METETPINRQRLTSPEQVEGTSAKELEREEGELKPQCGAVTLNGSNPTSFEVGELSVRSDWNQSMEEEEQLNNVSDVRLHVHGDEGMEKEVETNGTKPRTINERMVGPTLPSGKKNCGGKESKGQLNMSMTGIQNLEQPTHQHLPYLVKMMGELFQKALSEAIQPLKEEIRTLTKIIETSVVRKPQQPGTETPSEQAHKLPIWPRVPSGINIPHVPKITDRDQAFNQARRCIGLFPITQEDLIRNTAKMEECSNSSLKEQRGGAFTIRDYLCVVMKMDEREAERLNILRVFKQPGQGNMNVLFVEFTTEADLKKIRSLVTNMEKGGECEPRIIDFIPKLIQKEYDVVAQRAFKGRSMIPKNSSKIWITDKFELRLRPKGDFTPWSRIPQESLEQLPKQTGTKPKNNILGSQQHRPKPDFSTTSNPNFQQIGMGGQRKQSWEGPNLLPSQSTPSIASANIYSTLGEELNSRP